MVCFIVSCRLLDENFLYRAVDGKSFFLGGGDISFTISIGRVGVLQTTLAIFFERKFLRLS